MKGRNWYLVDRNGEYITNGTTDSWFGWVSDCFKYLDLMQWLSGIAVNLHIQKFLSFTPQITRYFSQSELKISVLQFRTVDTTNKLCNTRVTVLL
jgi:hypothetical protein